MASTPQLSSDAATIDKGVTLTAIAKDANNNVVPGVTVVFATPDSAEIVVENPAVTDMNGRIIATLTTGGNPQNRTVNVTATGGGISARIAIDVIGSTIDLQGPDSTQINVATQYIVQLTDAGGNAIADQAVTVSTNSGNTAVAATPETDAAGQVKVKLTATQAASTLTASALGLVITKAITVSTDEFSVTAPTTNAELPIKDNSGAVQTHTITARWFASGAPVPDGTRVDFAVTRGSLGATSATTVNGLASVNISSSESGPSIIVASSTARSRPSASSTVEFIATVPQTIKVQASPANLAVNQTSELTAVVRDLQDNLVKNATVEFSLTDSTGGNLSSPTAVTNSQGLAKIVYTATSQSSGSGRVDITGKVRGTSIQSTAELTVGGRAVNITIGTGADIVSKDTSTYQLPFTVLITDSSGNPVPSADFTLSLIPTAFYKGTFDDASRIRCPNEDVDLDDILDPSEDRNNNATLEPGRPASLPSTITLDSDGAGQFFVTYPKDHGKFVEVQIIGTASVAGTETTEKRTVLLSVAADDVPFLPQRSPYGVELSCASAN